MGFCKKKNVSETCIKRLCPRDGIPKHLVDYFEMSHLVQSLKCALLSPRAQVNKVGKILSISVCKQCHKSLKKTSTTNRPQNCNM